MIRRCVFRNNEVSAGGGVAVGVDCTVRIEDCLFEENHVLGAGGGVFGDVNSSPQIRRCTFIGNTGNEGGGIFLGGDEGFAEDCLIQGNQTEFGGGVSILFGWNWIRSCRIADNTAYFLGGGVYIGSYALGELDGCVIQGNQAPIAGAGYVQIADGLFKGCSITGNTGWNECGGVRLDGATLTVEDCEIRGNGTGIDVTWSINPIDAWAADNWWGDPSGPYHPTLNPGGLGDAVGDHVAFEPWRSSSAVEDPGNGDGGGDARDEGTPTGIAVRGQLQVLPNPSPGPVTIAFRAPQPGTAEVEIFDAAGRRVDRLSVTTGGDGTGAIAWPPRGRHTLQVASPILWARVRLGDWTSVERFVLMP